MGAVWRAEHVELGTPAAVKLIDASFAGSEEALGRFKREAQAAATLRSPHVVQILDYGVDSGTPYIAMELLEGESLADRIHRLGRLPPAAAANILTHVAKAIGQGHSMGIVHRDLKPENIFISRHEDDEIAKVLDYGIAKHTNDAAQSPSGPQTQTGAMLGTPFYMSPEQASGKKHVDHRTDLWALAIIAFECLTGRRPFQDDTLGGLVLAICTGEIPVPSQIAPVPPGFDEWFLFATNRDPTHRYQAARDAVAGLRHVCGLEDMRSSSADLGGVIAAEMGSDPQAANAAWAGAISGVEPTQLGATGAQAAPTSITVDTTARRRRTGWVVAAIAAGALLLVGGGVGAYAALSGGEPETTEPAAATVAAPEPPTVVASEKAPVVEPIPTPQNSAAEPVASAEQPEPPPPAAVAPPAPVPHPPTAAEQPAPRPAPAPVAPATPQPKPAPKPKPTPSEFDLAF